ncbi:hypothetical protein [Maledivibacter halophilus]|uniref:PKC-activated protein phosphatase-1 inhibitor n=1 Tax=Maledivibacter halophilus TaxID=36842 RepID=A0A1T5KGA0_9FIRM|nr:hypothetical protein [Maledivibacter halophilus]SKC62724.1 PKC-activated protein phosphatase-1 inhibitor [Maledivibacter halophilus]
MKRITLKQKKKTIYIIVGFCIGLIVLGTFIYTVHTMSKGLLGKLSNPTEDANITDIENMIDGNIGYFYCGNMPLEDSVNAISYLKMSKKFRTAGVKIIIQDCRSNKNNYIDSVVLLADVHGIDKNETSTNNRHLYQAIYQIHDKDSDKLRKYSTKLEDIKEDEVKAFIRRLNKEDY